MLLFIFFVKHCNRSSMWRYTVLTCRFNIQTICICICKHT